jgi:hypothetical protein
MNNGQVVPLEEQKLRVVGFCEMLNAGKTRGEAGTSYKIPSSGIIAMLDAGVISKTGKSKYTQWSVNNDMLPEKLDLVCHNTWGEGRPKKAAAKKVKAAKAEKASKVETEVDQLRIVIKLPDPNIKAALVNAPKTVLNALHEHTAGLLDILGMTVKIDHPVHPYSQLIKAQRINDRLHEINKEQQEQIDLLHKSNRERQEQIDLLKAQLDKLIKVIAPFEQLAKNLAHTQK